MPNIKFTFFNPQLEQIASFTHHSILSATWVRTINRIGTATIELPLKHIDFETYTARGVCVLIETENRVLETLWFLKSFSETFDNHTIQLTFKDALSILDNSIVAYRDNNPVGSSPNGVIQGLPSNQALNNIFETNWSTGASVNRNKSDFVGIAPVTALAPPVTKPIAFSNIFRTMTQIASASRDNGVPLYFDLVPKYTNNRLSLIFTTYLNHRGSNRSKLGTIRTTDQNFIPTSFVGDYSNPNRVYVGGSGRGAQRQVITQESLSADAGPFTRNEVFVSEQSGATAELQTAAQTILNGDAYVNTIRGSIVGELSDLFALGDVLLLEHRNKVYSCEVTSVRYDLSDQRLVKNLAISSRGT